MANPADACKFQPVSRQYEIQLVMVFIALGAIEFIAVHLALSSAPAMVQILHAILSLSFLVFLVAGLLSLRFNGIAMVDQGLRVPIDLFRYRVIPYGEIRAPQSAEAAGRESQQMRVFSILSEANLHLETDERVMPNLLGKERRISSIAMAVDDPGELWRLVEERKLAQSKIEGKLAVLEHPA